MQCGNERALASALKDRHVALSAVTVRCCDYLPALTDCGRFVIGDTKLRLDCFDHLPPALLVIEVERRDGILRPALEPTVDTSGAELDWMTYIRPARDRHEQNVELVLDYHSDGGGGLRLRTSRDLRPGDELLVWYGDQLALDLGVPLLTPANITEHAQYICTECSVNFRSPNPLKSHIMYHCNSSHRRPSPIFDYAYSNYSSCYSMLPLLLPPMTSSLPPTNYFRLMVGSTKATALQMLHDTETKGQSKRHGHSLPLPLPSVTSSPPPAIHFRLPTGSPTCPTKESRVLQNTEVQGWSQGQGKGRSTCWRPVCLDDEQSVDKEFDVSSRNSPAENTASHGCRSVTVPRPSAVTNRQTVVDLERAEATTTKVSADRKRRESVATTTDAAETGSRYVTSSRSHRSVLDGRHECSYCGKRYSRRYGLTIHVRTHTGHKPLQCAVCRRPFGDPSNLNKHVRLHAGDADTPYRCRHCGKVLVRRRDLERHIRSRHPDAVDTPSLL